MTQKEINEQCDAMYAQIKEAEEKLKEIRSICKHPDTFEGNYSFRIGYVLPAYICSDCHQLIKYK